MASGLQFFNPASILPSPDVAVNEPPRADYSILSGALGDALQHVRETVKQKRDMDNLTSDTLRLAKYVQTQSPALASYLTDKATSYDLFTTDPTKERADLMKGTIDFLGTETSRLKALQENNTRMYENMYRYKLKSAQDTYEALLRAKQEHEQQENVRIENEERARLPLIKAGKPSPDPVRRPFSGEGDLQKAKRNLDETMEMTPAEAAALSFSKKPGNIDPEASDMPLGQSRVETGLIPERNVGGPVTPVLFPEDEVHDQNQAPPAAPTDNTPAPAPDPDPLLTEKGKRVPGVNGPWALAPEGPPPTVISPENRANLSPANQAALANKETNENFLRLKLNRVRQVAEDAVKDKDKYLNPDDLAAFVARGQQLEKELSSMDNVGTEVWRDTVNELTSNYERDVAKLDRRNVAQTIAKEKEENASTIIMHIDGDPGADKEFPVRAVTTPTGIQFFTENPQTGEYDVPASDMVYSGKYVQDRTATPEDVKKFGSIRKKMPIPPAAPGATSAPAPVPAAKPGAAKPVPAWLQQLIDLGKA